MPSAITPKVPLTVVANQGIAGMATTVQVSTCEVLYNIVIFPDFQSTEQGLSLVDSWSRGLD